MLVMEELQKTYTVASIYRAIFTKAVQLIFPGYSVFGTLVSSASTPTLVPQYTAGNQNPMMQMEALGYTPFNEGTFGIGTEGDFMDALMDETSTFGLWEGWNQI